MTTGSDDSTYQALDTGAARADWLKAAIDKAIQYMDGQRNMNRRRSIALKMTTLILSGATAILLGLSVGGSLSELFRNLALVLVTLATLDVPTIH